MPSHLLLGGGENEGGDRHISGGNASGGDKSERDDTSVGGEGVTFAGFGDWIYYQLACG